MCRVPLQTDPPTLLPLQKSKYARDRKSWSDLAEILVYEQPVCLEKLEPATLVRPDGGCSLATARLLAQAYFRQGTLDSWVERLSQRLDDPALVGERRVSWRLARGLAEEIRKGGAAVPGVRGEAIAESYAAGHRWLEEARQAAESEETLQLIYQEMLTRSIRHKQWSEINSLLAQARTQLAQPTSLDAISQWEAEAQLQRAEAEQMHAGEAERLAAEAKHMQAEQEAKIMQAKAESARRIAEAKQKAEVKDRQERSKHEADVQQRNAQANRQLAERRPKAKITNKVPKSFYDEHVQERERIRIAELRRRLKAVELAKQPELAARYREQLRIWGAESQAPAPTPDAKTLPRIGTGN